METSNDTIGNRTRDLPTCTAVPQRTAPPRAPGEGWCFPQILDNFQKNCFACGIPSFLAPQFPIIPVTSYRPWQVGLPGSCIAAPPLCPALAQAQAQAQAQAWLQPRLWRKDRKLHLVLNVPFAHTFLRNAEEHKTIERFHRNDVTLDYDGLLYGRRRRNMLGLWRNPIRLTQIGRSSFLRPVIVHYTYTPKNMLRGSTVFRKHSAPTTWRMHAYFCNCFEKDILILWPNYAGKVPDLSPDKTKSVRVLFHDQQSPISGGGRGCHGPSCLWDNGQLRRRFPVTIS
jgi:hypothetical protein